MKMLKWFSLVLLVVFSMSNLRTVSAQEAAKINILLLGVDAGYEVDRVEDITGSRSDAIMIATIDPNLNTLTLSSIPRDSLVDIPGHGAEKVTHAFAYGGKDLAITTLEQWLGVDFDYYVISNMPGFVKIIDQFGGVDVVPPATFNWWEKFYFEKDVPQHLDGDHALAYARERMTSGGDYARQARMREMMTVIIKKLIADGSIENYRSMFEERYQYILTDFTFDSLTEVYTNYMNAETVINEFQLSGQGYNDTTLGYVDETNPASFEELMMIIK